jgi:hypothetical protein
MFYNEWDIMQAEEALGRDPILGPAVETLVRLRDWTNRNSDGWCYWKKPGNAAQKLIKLIDGAVDSRRNGQAHGVTAGDIKRAYVPIKAFLTRQHVNHNVIFDG